jgi:hypothetical protein
MQNAQNSRYFFYFFMFILIITGLIITYLSGGLIIEGLQSTGWPHAEGTISYSEVGSFQSCNTHSGCTTSQLAEVGYNFSVNGSKYIGNNIATGGPSGNPYAIVANYSTGSKVTVYYSPSDPNNSVLQPGLQSNTIFYIFIGLLLIAVPSFFIMGARKRSTYSQ